MMQVQTISSIVLFVLLLAMLYMILTNKALRSRLRSSQKVPPLFYKLLIGLIVFFLGMIVVAWIGVAYSNM